MSRQNEPVPTAPHRAAGGRCAAIERAIRRRRIRTLLGGLGAAVLLLAVVWMAALLRPARGVALVTVGADYATNLTVRHNASGWGSLQRLCQLLSETPSSTLTRPVESPLAAEHAFSWKDAVSELNGTAAILVVSLHGGADSEGPFLLRTDCTPAAGKSARLDVATLLEELRKLPETQSKIVFFEATATTGEWRYGESENRFVEGLRKLENEIAAIPGLVVVSASDSGQIAYNAVDGRRTIFLEALASGLGGAATDTNNDGRIDGAELASHLSQEVSQQAARVWGAEQTPVILPQGERGLERAAQIEVAYATPATAASPDQPRPLPRDEIGAMWKEASALASALSHPESEATLLWCCFRRLLIRHEQLLAAGAETRATASLLQDLQSQLRRQALATQVADDPIEPSRVAPDTAAADLEDAAFAALWSAHPDSLPTAITKAMATVPENQRPRWRRRFFDRAIARVLDDSSGQIAKGSELITALRDPLRPLPSDAHLVTILASRWAGDAGLAPMSDAIRLAITTRRLSESTLLGDEAYDSSLTPQALAWLGDRLLTADAERLRGEDLLLIGQDHRSDAVAHLTEAKRQYTRLQDEAAALRRGLTARDTALDLAPFYADVIASIGPVSAKSDKALDSLTESVEAVLNTAHRLSDLLLPALEVQQAPGELPQTIDRAAQKVEQAVAMMQARFGQWRARLMDLSDPDARRQRSFALLTPDLPVGERLRLLSAPAAVLSSAREMASANRQESALDANRRRGRLAVALVGKRLLEKYTAEPAAYERAVATVRSTDADGVVADCALAYWKCLDASKQVLRKAAASGFPDEPRSPLIEAADALRRLATGDSTTTFPTPLDRVQDCLRYDLCRWRAKRSIRSYWSDCQPGAQPRFQEVANAYLDEAERLVPGRDAVRRLRSLASSPSTLKLLAPAMVPIVSGVSPETSVAFTGQPTALGIAGGGVAAVSVASLSDLTTVGLAAGDRLAATLSTKPNPTGPAIAFLAGRDAPAGDRALQMEAWFRGGRFPAAVTLQNYKTPSVAAEEAPRPWGAGVAIIDQRDDSQPFSPGAIALVVDASGSMGPGDDRNSKYRQAISTVQTLLSDAPAGLQVSVWVFGQAVGAQKTTDQPEATIQQVLAPVRWNPADPNQLSRLIDRLSPPQVEPWNESPLTRAVLLASRDVRGAAGYKAVIAITDGVDNRFERDAFANPGGKPIGDVVGAELSGSGVALHLIGYRVAGAEQAVVKRQFAFLSRLTPVGHWWQADETASLERALRSALRSNLVASNEGGSAPLVTVTPAGRPLAWSGTPLPNGLYDLPTTTPAAAGQQALLDGGDLLLLRARETALGVQFSPVCYSKTNHPTRPAIETAGWRTALLSDRQLPNGDRCSLITVERQMSSDEDLPTPLRVARPAELWIERANRAAPSITWRRVDGYPAPCWEVIGRGEQESNGDLVVWWNDTPSPSTGVLRPNGALNGLAALIGQEVNVDGTTATIRQIALQPRRVPNAKGAITEQNCLVIEMESPERVTIGLRGYTPAGERQEWYDEVGVSVATFWPLTAEALSGAVTGLNVTSIASAKLRAEAAGRIARFDRLPPPSSSDQRPTPAVGWFDPVEASLPQHDARRTTRSSR
ncbi:hypothetical protein Pla108_19410 [Botrimarina colliarenosi]|uniref:VWFA domain-containing protein n=1 Tax=Botrimarina colliarenosi TaxID=2528001 RepID=A0A5C6ADT7_9BACT|nr:vWA domain-containing protein [Botrimarina colliarenosi]TWT97789.1 hypothetical protein Pla108_19410 [Botrimarina colliarenosi]